MEYKSGDKIILISDKGESDYYKKYIGKVFTVENPHSNYVTVKERGGINPYVFNIVKVDKIENYDLKNAPIGTRVTFKCGECIIKSRNNIYNNDSHIMEYGAINKKNILKIEEPQYKVVYMDVFDILDEDDKRYIKSVIRPFRDKVKYITKRSRDLGREFISITLNDNFIINLPFFAKGTMYNNMESDMNYTLEGLNI